MRLSLRRAPREAPTLPPLAQQLAEAHAATDRALLARLRERGQVQLRRRDIPDGMRREAKAFIADIEGRVAPARNLAIRPKRKKAKR